MGLSIRSRAQCRSHRSLWVDVNHLLVEWRCTFHVAWYLTVVHCHRFNKEIEHNAKYFVQGLVSRIGDSNVWNESTTRRDLRLLPTLLINSSHQASTVISR